MANQIIREELKRRKVYQWELAHELGISEQTILRKMRYEMSLEEQRNLLKLIKQIHQKKEK